MKIHSLVLISLLAFGTFKSSITNADTDLENAALARIINILNATKPLIDEAERQQDTSTRVQFQYQALRDDINKIKVGIDRKLTTTTIEPRVVTPIQGDYLQQKGNRQ